MENTKLEKILDLIEELLTGLHEQQMGKARKIARKKLPYLSDEDLLNPDDYPEIVADPAFTYEDGIAAGILSAKMAIRARLKESV